MSTNAGIHEDYDPAIIPSYLKKDVRETIEVAMALGWVMHISSSNSVTIVSPDEQKKHHFSSSGRTSTPMNRIRRDIVKRADPAKLKLAYEGSDLFKRGVNRELAGIALAALPLPYPGEEGTVVDHRPDIAAEAAAERRKKNERIVAARRVSEAAKRTLDEQSKPQPETETEATQTTQKEASGPKQPQETPGSDSEPHIVSKEPMMAKSSKGKGYRSRVAIERHWSDGSVDYKCVDCDYTTPHRLSIRGHRGAAGHPVRGGRGPGEDIPTEVPLAVHYNPRQTRVEALAEELKALLEGELDPEEIARRALIWVNEQSRQGTRHAAEHEPLTAEDTLARIRLLLDDGTQARVVAERDQQIETLFRENEKLVERVEELESFIELAQSLRRKDTE